MREAGPTPARKRRWLLATPAVLMIVAGIAFACYYAVRRAEAQAALRYYQTAFEYHDAGSVNDQFLGEMSAQAMEAQLRVPFANFDHAAAEHVGRIESMREQALPWTRERGGAARLELLDALLAEAREWHRKGGERPTRDQFGYPVTPP